jgi:hypothetical protein
MASINLARVLLGGLVSGLVANVIGYLFRLAFEEEMAAALTRLGLTEPAGRTVAILIALGFVYGIVAVWFYAAARPRFGAGIRTAVIVAIALWIVSSLLINVQFALLGLLEGNLPVIGTIADLVIITVSLVAGAWVYRE